MKARIWALAFAAALVFGVSAGSAFAQRDASSPASRHQRYDPDHPVTPPAPAADDSQLKPRSNASPDSTDTCTYKFTSGSGNTYLQFCVTVNGNVVEFQSPVGIEQLSPGGSAAYEGYGICDVTTGTAYWDYAGNGDSGNWNAPTKLSLTGTSVKIERITSDGAWTLTQTFTSVEGFDASAKIAMALKNDSAEDKQVVLLRYANAVPYSGSPYQEDYDGTYESAWGYAQGFYGLILQDVGFPTPTTLAWEREAFPIDTIGGPAPCNADAKSEEPILGNVGSLVNWVEIITLKKAQTVTVTDRYMQF
jgi:hypothetical protein